MSVLKRNTLDETCRLLKSLNFRKVSYLNSIIELYHTIHFNDPLNKMYIFSKKAIISL